MPVQTEPEAHSASRTMGTGSIPGLSQLGRGADIQRPSCEWLELYLRLPTVQALVCHGVNLITNVLSIDFTILLRQMNSLLDLQK